MGAFSIEWAGDVTKLLLIELERVFCEGGTFEPAFGDRRAACLPNGGGVLLREGNGVAVCLIDGSGSIDREDFDFGFLILICGTSAVRRPVMY